MKIIFIIRKMAFERAVYNHMKRTIRLVARHQRLTNTALKHYSQDGITALEQALKAATHE